MIPTLKKIVSIWLQYIVQLYYIYIQNKTAIGTFKKTYYYVKNSSFSVYFTKVLRILKTHNDLWNSIIFL